MTNFIRNSVYKEMNKGIHFVIQTNLFLNLRNNSLFTT